MNHAASLAFEGQRLALLDIPSFIYSTVTGKGLFRAWNSAGHGLFQDGSVDLRSDVILQLVIEASYWMTPIQCKQRKTQLTSLASVEIPVSVSPITCTHCSLADGAAASMSSHSLLTALCCLLESCVPGPQLQP